MKSLLRIKTAARSVHRYLGLVSAVFVVSAAGSGMIIQWDEELIKLVGERSIWVSSQDCRHPCDLVGAADLVAKSAPRRKIDEISVSAPFTDRVAIEASVTLAGGGGDRSRIVAVPPALTGKPIWLAPNAGLMRRVIDAIYTYHHSLLAGVIGSMVMTAGAAALVLLALLGLLLWWPMTRLRWRSFRFQARVAGRAWLYDRHRTSGFYASAVILGIAATGFLLNLFDIAPELAPRPTSVVADHSLAPAEASDAYAAQRLAISLFPNADYVSFKRPVSRARPFDFAFRQPGDPNYGRTHVLIDQRSGVAEVIDAIKQPPAVRLTDTLLALHNGQIAGLTGRAINMAAAVAIVFLTIVGTLSWHHRIRERKRRARSTSRT